jgi:hypothetical protein
MTDEIPDFERIESLRAQGLLPKKKKKQKTHAKQRSMKYLRDLGWSCADVEKWIPPRGKMKFGVRQDAFGIGDILACKPTTYRACPNCSGTGEGITKTWPCSMCKGTSIVVDQKPLIALVQCFSDTGALVGFESHRTKILALPAAMAWIKSHGKIYLHGWKKRKAGWILTEEEVVLAS